MAIASTTTFVDSLRQTGLLDAAQLKQITPAALERFPEPRAFAKALVKKGWLTTFQAKALLEEKPQELTLGQYVILERLGEGGMGQVFKAKHRVLGRVVALKVIRKDRMANPDAIKRFQREIKAASQLAHPNVIQAIDADQVGDVSLLIMEYVEGTDLSRLVKEQGPLPVGKACNYMKQAALGLQHAFEHGMVHRDIKPSNFLLSKGSVVKLLDLGLTLQEDADSPNLTMLTRDGSVVGTPDYMAPEQARNSHTVDVRADIYSLGCTFYVLLTGQVVFQGGTGMEKVFRHQLEEPKPVEQLRPEVPPAVSAIVRKLLSKRPEDRYQTPAELAQALTPFAAAENDSNAVRLGAEGNGAGVGDTAKSFKTKDSPVVAETLLLDEVPPPAPRGKKLAVTVAGALALMFLCIAVTLAVVMRKGNKADNAGTTPPGTTPENTRPALDELDPARIPSEERLAGSQPDTLVAVLGEHRWRAWGQIMVLAASPDGKRAASAGWPDNVIRIWDTESGRELANLRGHDGAVISALAFSPDGDSLLSAGFDQKVRTWNLRDMQPRDPIPESEVKAVAFAPDSKKYVTASTRGGSWEVKLHGSPQPKVYTFPRPTDPRPIDQIFLAFDPTGTALAVGTWFWRPPIMPPPMGDPPMPGKPIPQPPLIQIKLLDAATMTERKNFEEPGNLRGIRFQKSGKFLLAVTAGNVRLIDIEKGTWNPSQPAQSPVVIGLASQARTVVGNDPADTWNLRVWENQKSRPELLSGHRGQIEALAISPDGNTLASVSKGTGKKGQAAMIKLWNIAAGLERAKLDIEWEVKHLAFTPDGQMLAAWGPLGVRVWRTASAEARGVIGVAGGKQGWVRNVTLSPDSKHLAVAVGPNVALYDLAGTDQSWSPRFSKPYRLDTWLAFSPDNRLLAAVGDREVRTWQVATGQDDVALSHQAAGRCSGAIFTPDGKGLFQARPGDVRLVDFPSGRERANSKTTARPDYELLATPDGQMVVIKGLTSLRLWERGKPEFDLLQDRPVGGIFAAALSPNGKTLAFATQDARLVLWDLASRTPQEWTLPGQAWSLAFSADSRYLASGNGNGTVYIYRLR